MNESILALTEQDAVERAARYLEAVDPRRALTLLRGVRLKHPESPDDASSDHHEIQRLRTYIEQAILEIEIRRPGHALRTLRLAVGREPLG
jgi:hypothetical protein